jgi:drug/metabolite transporter (DMT)-like permease
VGILLGLASALCWGSSDFLGGRLTRRFPAFTVTLFSYSSGLLLLLLLGLLIRPDVHGHALAWGLVAGVVTSFGGLSLYQGLATGDAGIVATLSGCGAVVPVVFAFSTGDTPSALQTCGIGMALFGGILASVPPEGVRFYSSDHWKPVFFGAAAAVGFGLFFVLVDKGTRSDGDALVVLASGRFGAVACVGLAGSLARSVRWPGRAIWKIGLAGSIDIAANGSFALATTRGNLAVASVLASLYPLQTLLLSRLFNNERFTRLRILGAALAVGGVAVISLG